MGVAFNFEEIIRIGVEIEKNGGAFYTLAAKSVDDASAKEVLEKLATWETEHISIFETILKEEQCDACVADSWYEDENSRGVFKSIADSHIFTNSSAEEQIGKCDTALDVFDIALQFEKDSVALYEALKGMVSPSCNDREKVQKVIDEEMMHVTVIQKEIKKMRESKA